MQTHRTHDNVLETTYTTEDLHRAHDASQPTVENTGNPAYSKALMTQYKRAKKAGRKNDIRSQNIIAELRAEHKKKFGNDTKHRVKKVQRTIADF